ncbi:hypothetical protein [Streptomyces bungoensis]|uniref:hypothetical protein n=1 Tax=Streptomyces bungoensis TaxID=285568 RepID=UPI00131D12B8|nr:hypothetical protein [Streptomyces bungoensis]
MTSYPRRQATTAALVNVVINSLITWLGRRRNGFVPLTGSRGLTTDVVVTSLLLSPLVSLFVTKAVRHDPATGRVVATAGLPADAWRRGCPRGGGRSGCPSGRGRPSSPPSCRGCSAPWGCPASPRRDAWRSWPGTPACSGTP